MTAVPPAGPPAGIRFVLIAMAVFAVQDGISRHLAAHYPVPWFVMFRYWFFALFVLALSAGQPGGIRAAAATRAPLLQIGRGVLLVVQILVIVSSFEWIGLSTTHSIFALHPLLATLLAVPLLGERVGWRRFAAIGVGFLGMLLILRPGLAVFDPMGLVAVGSSLLFAFYAVLTRLANTIDGHSRASFFYTGVAGAVAITLVGPFFATPMSGPDIGWLVVLSLAGVGGHYCLIRAYDEAEAVQLQPFVYLQMVFAILVGVAVFGETLDVWTLAGMSMIVGAGLYAIWREMRLAALSRGRRPGTGRNRAPPS